MQIQRAYELAVAHDEFVEGTVGELSLARTGIPGLVSQAGQDAGQIAAACRDPLPGPFRG
jgi:hypothetical protein